MNKSVIQKVLIALATLSLFASSTPARNPVQKSLQENIQARPASSTLEVLLSFDGNIDLAVLKMDNLRRPLNRADRYREVMSRLRSARGRLEADILPHLERMKASGNIDYYKVYTISQTILVKTRIDNISALAELPGIEMISENREVSLIEPTENYERPLFAKTALANSALEAINIRSLWERGLNGSGSLICSFDTGIEGDHPALGARWRGNNGGTSAASWFAPHGGDFPSDNIGHGTHVMGVMVGAEGADTIGVAPGSQWISAAVVDQGVSFSTTIADILSAFDWAINPDGNINTTEDVPDVICNSWGIPQGIFDDCDNTFWAAIDNVEAAGIVTVFAAGNEGPDAESLRNPADRASSPLNSLSVGAVDPQTLAVADFSSRGPSSCDGVSIKPELVAPGVGIYSSYKDGGYRVMSGSSMATPFVAGLVALMRQYNPEATVEEIKNALVQAANDLGPAGEDNSYGYGVIDAARVLDFLPAPEMPNITILDHHLYSGGDGYADPGEIAELTLTLNEPTALVDSVDVWISSGSSDISVFEDTVRYYFAQGSTYAVSLDPFTMQISTEAVSGGSADLTVHFRFLSIPGFDSVSYFMDIGHQLPGLVQEVDAGNLKMDISDFGQFGFGMGSIYQAGGRGLLFNESGNLLFESGLIVGRSAQMVSDAVRDQNGLFKESDFMPVPSDNILAAGFDESLASEYNDNAAELPIPVRVEQQVYASTGDFMIMEFTVINPTASRLDHLAMGLFLDLDLDRFSDRIGFDTMMSMLYHYNENEGIYIGLAGVSANEFSFSAGLNHDSVKAGFTQAEKFGLVDRTGLHIEEQGEGDWYCLISRQASQIEAFAGRKMSVVVAAGNSLSELRAAMRAGMDEYDQYLDADDRWVALPSSMDLSQNYPNPFNPQTTIKFALGSSQNACLNVYNVTGQKVRTLFDGYTTAGEQSVIWDGCDDSGEQVASGVYFYRLTTDEETQTRKMLLLK